jgi:hypothetical protein
MHQGRARGYNNALQALIDDIVLDERLPWIRTHVCVMAGNHHITQPRRVVSHTFHVHHSGDIGATMANIHTDPGAAFVVVIIWCSSLIVMTLSIMDT